MIYENVYNVKPGSSVSEASFNGNNVMLAAQQKTNPDGYGCKLIHLRFLGLGIKGSLPLFRLLGYTFLEQTRALD